MQKTCDILSVYHTILQYYSLLSSLDLSYIYISSVQFVLFHALYPFTFCNYSSTLTSINSLAPTAQHTYTLYTHLVFMNSIHDCLAQHKVDLAGTLALVKGISLPLPTLCPSFWVSCSTSLSLSFSLCSCYFCLFHSRVLYAGLSHISATN